MSSYTIYICGDASATNTSTMAFQARGLKKYTVGRLSQLHLFAKPTESQFAYGGYRNSIEHFVAATAYKQKLLTSAEHVPLPDTYVPTVPMPLPSIIVRLGAIVTDKLLGMFVNKLKDEGINQVELGKGAPAFEIESPTWNTVYSLGPKYFNRYCGRTDYRAQVGDLLLFKPVYQFIDAFLATNTYPYKKANHRDIGRSGKTDVLGVEIRTHDTLWRSGFGEKPPKKQRVEEGKQERRKIDVVEPLDLTPNSDTIHSVGQTVFVAKPSPLPSSTSWGTPSSVPNVGGLVFPYFPGMLQHDLPGTRDIIGRLMFRALGSETVSAREAYSELRSKMGSVLNTEGGLILSHVLKGMDLALEAQAQLYLLFDRKAYMGFCLLGEEFQVFSHGVWVHAASPEDLRLALRDISTSEQALELLKDKIGSLSVGMDGLDSVKLEDLDNSYKLLQILARLSLSDDEEIKKKQEDEIYSLVGRCNLPSKYLPVTPDNIEWCIDAMTSDLAEGFPFEEFPIYIPPNRWNVLNTKTYACLAAFGPRSISFRNMKGDEFTIPDPSDEKCKWNEKEGKDREVYPCIIYVKAVRECLNDWNQVVESGKLRMDYLERAGGVRAHKFFGEKKKTVWQALWRNKKSFGIGKAPVEKVDKGKGKAKALDSSFSVDDFAKDFS